MTIEINEKFVKANEDFNVGGVNVMITPPIGFDYWVFRVQLFKDQALIAFPKFTTIGIGFAIEDDWNTNLPYTQKAEDIYEHIEHNRLYDEITKEMIIEAIELLQKAATALKEQKPDNN